MSENTETLQEQKQELSIIESSLQEFTDAGTILRTNQSRAEKALAIGRKILVDLEANGGVMTPELDARMQNYLANCNTAKTQMNEARKQFTQTLTLIRDAFTSEESKLDKDKTNTLAYQIQQIRNAYAQQLHEEEMARQRQAKEKQAREEETINLKAECKRRAIKWVGELILAEKTRIQNTFNAISLTTYEEKSAGLKKYEPVLSYERYKGFSHGLYSKLFTKEQIDSMMLPELESYFMELAEDYKKQLTELKVYLEDRLPSKLIELKRVKELEEEQERERLAEAERQEALKTANAAKQEELRKQQEEAAKRTAALEEEQRKQREEQEARELEEKARLKTEHEAQQETAVQQVEMNAEIEKGSVLFETEMALTGGEEHKPEARVGYEIEVLGPAAWLALFQQWFNLEGVTMGPATLEKRLGFVKKFCEDVAHKDESKKIQTGLIRYKQSFKAVNRKAK